MAHNIPSPDTFTGHSRTVIEYGERFRSVVENVKDSSGARSLGEAFESLVDVENFIRQAFVSGGGSSF